MEELAQRLMRTFLGELEERLQALNHDLVALEESPHGPPGAALLTSLFRTAHSLKGAAASVGSTAIETACHRLEERFAALRDGQETLDAGLLETLFAGADAIAQEGARLGDIKAGDTRPAAPPPAEPRSDIRPSAAAWAPPEPATTDDRVRVSLGKLDGLIARSGELLIAQDRSRSRVGEIAAMQDFVRRWRAEWNTADAVLTRLHRAAGTEPGNGRIAGIERKDAERSLVALSRARDNFGRLDRELDRLTTTLAGDCDIMKRAAGAVVAEASRIRMLPFAEICAGLDRVVRDVAKTARRDVRLVLRGQDVELDRAILERLRDPLIHLLKNAVGHGIEPAAERIAAGKPATGEIVVAASLAGACVEVRIADDGRGLAMAAIRERARRDHLPEGDARDLAQYIFRAGFSTEATATEIFGRGVGLDAVKAAVEAMRGTVVVSFEPGGGTEFLLRLPLTLTTLRAVLVRTGEQILGFDAIAVARLVRVAPAEIRSIEGRTTLMLEGAPVRLAWLDEILGIAAEAEKPEPAMLTAVLVRIGARTVGFVVDEVIGEQEVTVRDLGRRLRRVRHIAAATILASGRIVLILHAAELAATATERRSPGPRRARAAATGAATRRRVLLAEDSFTTRTLEKSILEAAGYDVAAFADGEAAWKALQEDGADIVVTDVEMPRLDGFGLTEAIRATPRFRELPVVLVTSRESASDRERGLVAGANAYLVKGSFDQQKLLDSLTRLL